MSTNTPGMLIERTLRTVVDLIVRKDYAGLERLTNGVRLTAAQIEAAISGYGRTVVAPPPAAFSRIDVIPVQASVPSAYSIRFRLYTLEEGESDWEVQATFIENPAAEQMAVELDNVLVA